MASNGKLFFSFGAIYREMQRNTVEQVHTYTSSNKLLAIMAFMANFSSPLTAIMAMILNYS